MQQAKILIIGSNGKTGRRVKNLLAERDIQTRAGSRSAEPAFDWQQPSGWPRILSGIKSVYITYYPDLAIGRAPADIEMFITHAKQAGVEHLVLLSGRGESNAQRCEQLVRDSGLDFTLIRASWFAQNFSEGHLYEPVLQGLVALPAADVREPFVDVDDIADVAVASLTDPKHIGQLYDVTGPSLLSFAEAAAEISKACGRDVQYAAITPEQFHAALKVDLGIDFANMLTDLCKEVLDGRNATLGDGVQKALGRKARDFSNYCKAVAVSNAWTPSRKCS